MNWDPFWIPNSDFILDFVFWKTQMFSNVQFRLSGDSNVQFRTQIWLKTLFGGHFGPSNYQFRGSKVARRRCKAFGRAPVVHLHSLPLVGRYRSLLTVILSLSNVENGGVSLSGEGHDRVICVSDLCLGRSYTWKRGNFSIWGCLKSWKRGSFSIWGCKNNEKGGISLSGDVSYGWISYKRGIFHTPKS